MHIGVGWMHGDTFYVDGTVIFAVMRIWNRLGTFKEEEREQRLPGGTKWKWMKICQNESLHPYRPVFPWVPRGPASTTDHRSRTKVTQALANTFRKHVSRPAEAGRTSYVSPAQVLANSNILIFELLFSSIFTLASLHHLAVAAPAPPPWEFRVDFKSSW